MLLDDMGDYLTSQGHGATTTSTGASISIFRNFLPAEPDSVITMIETGGLPPIHAMASSPGQAKVEQPGVQILVRHNVSDTARVNIDSVFKSVDGFRTRTINGVRYLWMTAVQSPFLFDRDESRREIFAFNLHVVKELS